MHVIPIDRTVAWPEQLLSNLCDKLPFVDSASLYTRLNAANDYLEPFACGIIALSNKSPYAYFYSMHFHNELRSFWYFCSSLPPHTRTLLCIMY